MVTIVAKKYLYLNDYVVSALPSLVGPAVFYQLLYVNVMCFEQINLI